MPYHFVGSFSHATKKYANNELWTVLFTDKLSQNSPAIVACQWTETADGRKKHKDTWRGKITNAGEDTNGQPITIEIYRGDSNLYYWFEGSVDAQRDKISLTMKNPSNENCGSVAADIVFRA